MTTVRRAVLACAVAGSALAPAQAAAAPLVRAEPSLQPGFQSAAPDYAVRCRAGTPVRLSIDAPAGTTVSIDGAGARGGSFERPVDLVPGEASLVRVKSSKGARNYHIRCLPPDFPRWKAKRYGKPQAAFYVLTPNHNSFDPGYTTVVDSRGVPLWWMRSSTSTFDGHLLPSGDLAWNHWVGNSPESGPFEERALDGHLVRTWDTVGHATNQHDLRVLPNGNALIISYPPRDHVDLSKWGGPSDATVLDGEIQEVTPAGGLVWSWRTNERLRTAEAGRWLDVVLHHESPIHLKDGRTAYDLVHVNSAEPDGAGRVVFSARYEDAVYEVDRTTHDVVWKLGGRHTDQSLRLVNDELPANQEFGGNHDARVPAGHGSGVVTLYDNGTLMNRPPRALAYRIDTSKRTAKMIRSIKFPPANDSVCCGSARWLPGGDWVVAWGHTPWVTEQTDGGKRVFTLEFNRDDEMSYRAEPVLPGRLDRSALRRGMDAMVKP